MPFTDMTHELSIYLYLGARSGNVQGGHMSYLSIYIWELDQVMLQGAYFEGTHELSIYLYLWIRSNNAQGAYYRYHMSYLSYYLYLVAMSVNGQGANYR